MTIITAAGLSGPYQSTIFNKNGSIVTLKKISETDWLLFGDVAEGDSEGFTQESSISCESQPSWEQSPVTFGVSMGELFWAVDDYSLGVDAFFAYDSTSVRQQTGGFTTSPPEGVDWMLMGWNPDGGIVIAVKPLDGFPMVSIGTEAQIELSSDEGIIILQASRGTVNKPYSAETYEHQVEYVPNKTVCVQMSILNMT